jgi:glutamyl-Q tRNA(Asp) synthetase
MAARKSALVTMSSYVGRFAPSPTGPLHFGSLVAAVASYADARAAGGQWILRIEDVDTTRCNQAAENKILHQLASHGFMSDGQVVRQSERSAHYQSALNQLAQANQLYACACTRKQLLTAPKNAEGETIYPGTCRSAVPFHLNFLNAAVRLRVPDDARSRVRFVDRSVGEVAQNVATDIGDFVLMRADGLHSYQLAVTVDDALQGVTHVVRGEDLLMNTPRQIYLQQRLGLATPRYLHVPLVRNGNGEKLSKQTRAEPIGTDSGTGVGTDGAQTPLARLSQAWHFLKQPELGPQDSVQGFWQAAAQAWRPERLRGDEKA